MLLRLRRKFEGVMESVVGSLPGVYHSRFGLRGNHIHEDG